MKEREVLTADKFGVCVRLCAKDVEIYFGEQGNRIYRESYGCGDSGYQKAFE
ncbi:hypothetical protein OAJ77_00585 [Rhodospirillales bacterium]|nr:hypothetical protein [Rhodospirillales bacterium]